MYSEKTIDEQVRFYREFDKLKAGATNTKNYKLDVGKFNEFLEKNVMAAWSLAEQLSLNDRRYIVVKNLLTPSADKMEPSLTTMPAFEDIEKARQIMQNYSESEDINFRQASEDDVILYQKINNCLDVLKHAKLYNKIAKDHINGLDKSI